MHEFLAPGPRVKSLLQRVDGQIAPQSAGKTRQPTVDRETTSMTNAT